MLKWHGRTAESSQGRCKVRRGASSSLLFADDMVILAEEEEELRRGLGVLEEWCSEWAMKVNADKCGVIHMVHVRGRATAVGGAECLAMEV